MIYYEINEDIPSEVLRVEQHTFGRVATHHGYVEQVCSTEADKYTTYYHGVFNLETGEYDNDYSNPEPITVDGVSYDLDENHEVVISRVYEYVTTKLDEINTACQSTIYAGIDVETSEGVKHFSLTEHDQTELAALTSQIKDGVLSAVPYHADGELCKFWSIEDFVRIAEAARSFIFYHRTYCNHLREYIKRIEDKDILLGIEYGDELPEDLQEKLDGLLLEV